MTMAKKEVKERTVIRCVKAPLRMLINIRNFYIYSMIQCSGHIGPGGGFPAPQIRSLPRTCTINSGRRRSISPTLDEDLRELIKVASTRRLTDIIPSGDGVLRRQKSAGELASLGPGFVYKKSSTVTRMGRIDEEEPCEFEVDDLKIRENVLPRSQSHT